MSERDDAVVCGKLAIVCGKLAIEPSREQSVLPSTVGI